MTTSNVVQTKGNAKQIFARINTLIQSNYEEKLTKSEQFILGCLLSGMTCPQIAILHRRIRVDTVENIAADLMKKLSKCLQKTVNLDNFQLRIESYL